MSIEMIYGTVAALLAGLNIFQVIFWRIEKQKMKGLADAATIEAGQKDVELVKMLRTQLAEALKENFEAQAARNDDAEKHLGEITKLREEIVKLKDEISDLKSEIETLRTSKTLTKPKAPAKKRKETQ